MIEVMWRSSRERSIGYKVYIAFGNTLYVGTVFHLIKGYSEYVECVYMMCLVLASVDPLIEVE